MAMVAHPMPKISPSVFFGVQWFLAGLTLILLSFRLYVRISNYRRIWIDDILVIAAWLMFLASNILWHFQLDAAYTLFNLLTTHIFPSANDIYAIVNLLRATSAFQVLFYCSLWFIKFSFLMFFRRLGDRLTSKRIRIWWWTVTVITVAGLAVTLGTGQYKCSTGDATFLITYCGGDAAKAEQTRDTRIATAMDVLTDGLVTSIPFTMLWFTHLPIRKKLGLIGLFSLSLLIMIFALIRLLVLPNENIAVDVSWTYMWSNIEVGVAILVACLGAFRQLYVNKQDKNSKGYNTGSSRSNGGWNVFKYFHGGLFRSSNKSTPRPTKTISTNASSVPPNGHQGHFNTMHGLDTMGDSTLRDTLDISTISSQHEYAESIHEVPAHSAHWSMNQSIFIDHTRSSSSSRETNRQDSPGSFEMVSPLSIHRSIEKIV